MSGVVCSSCGAPLALPHDLTALDASCAYCNVQTPLPLHVVELRLHEHAQLAQPIQRAAPLVEPRPVAGQASVDDGGFVPEPPLRAVDGAKARSVVLWLTLFTTLFPLLITGLVVALVVSSASQAAHRPSSPHGPASHAARRR